MVMNHKLPLKSLVFQSLIKQFLTYAVNFRYFIFIAEKQIESSTN